MTLRAALFVCFLLYRRSSRSVRQHITQSECVSLSYSNQPVHSKGGQSWMFIGRADAKAETPVLWPPSAENQFFGKDADLGKD